ncbi:hypothetical protein [Nitrobacter sp. TKz-YC02]|uniref:hypothetical protein n=1 Tax=Nitrobacter sp. TKz-YC02 TaxID=3398704 RepID=UPI003CF9D184
MKLDSESKAVAVEQDDGSFCILTPDSPPWTVRFPEAISASERQLFLHEYLRQYRKEIGYIEVFPLTKRSPESQDEKQSNSEVVETAEPPRLAEAAFAWLAPKGTVDAQLGDLQELFGKKPGNTGLP